MANKMDLEETNRIRVSLGMQPLPSATSSGKTNDLSFKKSSADDASESEEEASTLETRQAAAGSNWLKAQQDQDQKRKREDQRAQLKKQREAAQRFAKLEGKGLGEGDGDDVDTRSWLVSSQRRQKKIQKERAKALAREQAEKEKAAEYTQKDLAGARVGHEVDDFEDGDEHILTLKDAAVDADSDEGDELENLNVREKEKLRERLDSKKKKAAYDPNDVNDDGSKTILAKYDEEIDGKKRRDFTLDVSGAASKAKKTRPGEQSVPGRIMVSLDDLLKDDKPPISDYQDAPEVKIRKPKKKKDRTKKRRAAEDDENDSVAPTGNGTPMDVDETDGSAPKRKRTEAFVDEDDLQAELAATRRAALKKRKKMTPEEIARQLRAPSDSPPPMDTAEEGGLVFDETSRFVENLQGEDSDDERAAKRRHSSNGVQSSNTIKHEVTDDEGDVVMEHPTASEIVKREESEEATAESEAARTATGLAGEASLSGGLGSTLALLRERGLVHGDDPSDRNAQYRARQRFLAEVRVREQVAAERARQDRERDRASGRLNKMSIVEREEWSKRQNDQRATAESRAAADLFNRDYKPSVDLKYVDEFGRNMTSKEAFKHLSHQFHGKGSGKGKTEKRLKKIEEERAREAASGLSGGVGGAGGEEGARKRGQAGVRLQ